MVSVAKYNEYMSIAMKLLVRGHLSFIYVIPIKTSTHGVTFAASIVVVRKK